MEITSIIKYEGDNSTFVWKHPKEDFNTLSQLIVHCKYRIHSIKGHPSVHGLATTYCALCEATARTPECPGCFVSLCSVQGTAPPVTS